MSARDFAADFTGEKSLVLPRIVRELHAGFRGTLAELAPRVHASPRTVEMLMAGLHSLGLARVVAWTTPVGRGGRAAVWAFGPGRHAPQPSHGGVLASPERSGVCRNIVAHLAEHGPAGQIELRDALGLAYAILPRYMRAMREAGMVHIDAWVSRPPRPIYAAGMGVDAKKPMPIPAARLSQRRKRVLREIYGKEIASRICLSRKQGGPERIVIDGRTVYERRQACPTT